MLRIILGKKQRHYWLSWGRWLCRDWGQSVFRRAGIEICVLSTACNVTLTALMKSALAYISLVWEERKTHPGSTGTRRQQLAAGQTLLKSWDKDGAREGIILFHFWCIYFNQMMKIPARDRCLICDDDSDLIRSAAKPTKAEHHQTQGRTHDIPTGYWLQE